MFGLACAMHAAADKVQIVSSSPCMIPCGHPQQTGEAVNQPLHHQLDCVPSLNLYVLSTVAARHILTR
jgi:hypothetical protein